MYNTPPGGIAIAFHLSFGLVKFMYKRQISHNNTVILWCDFGSIKQITLYSGNCPTICSLEEDTVIFVFILYSNVNNVKFNNLHLNIILGAEAYKEWGQSYKFDVSSTDNLPLNCNNNDCLIADGGDERVVYVCCECVLI